MDAVPDLVGVAHLGPVGLAEVVRLDREGRIPRAEALCGLHRLLLALVVAGHVRRHPQVQDLAAPVLELGLAPLHGVAALVHLGQACRLESERGSDDVGGCEVDPEIIAAP